MSKTLIIDGIKFNLWVPDNEKEQFHPIVKEHAKEIFGQDTVYLDIALRLKSETGLGAEPDGFIIDPVRKELYIAEVELSKHDVYKHINDQLTRFINGIDNPRTKSIVVEALYDEINDSKTLGEYFDEKIDENLHRWLSQLLSQPPKIVVVIEEKTDVVVEACKILTKSFDTRILEFQTFLRENAPTVHAHLYEPLHLAEKQFVESRKRQKSKTTLPEHYQSWEKMLAWVDDSPRDLVKELTNSIRSLGEANPRPVGRYYCFYKGKFSTKSIFAAFLLKKRSLKVRIRTDPKTFIDERNWVGDKIYKGWFFKQGQEREFEIQEKVQIRYAMELIKHSYGISG